MINNPFTTDTPTPAASANIACDVKACAEWVSTFITLSRVDVRLSSGTFPNTSFLSGSTCSGILPAIKDARTGSPGKANV